LSPAVLILAFVSCWSIAVVGGYLALVGVSNLRHEHLVSQPPVARRAHILLQRPLFVLWGVLLLLLGGLQMTVGMVFFYTLFYS
jgi:hypothetical protein